MYLNGWTFNYSCDKDLKFFDCCFRQAFLNSWLRPWWLLTMFLGTMLLFGLLARSCSTGGLPFWLLDTLSLSSISWSMLFSATLSLDGILLILAASNLPMPSSLGVTSLPYVSSAKTIKMRWMAPVDLRRSSNAQLMLMVQQGFSVWLILLLLFLAQAASSGVISIHPDLTVTH